MMDEQDIEYMREVIAGNDGDLDEQMLVSRFSQISDILKYKSPLDNRREGARSPSPEPVYDDDTGARINGREERMHRKLVGEQLLIVTAVKKHKLSKKMGLVLLHPHVIIIKVVFKILGDDFLKRCDGVNGEIVAVFLATLLHVGMMTLPVAHNLLNKLFCGDLLADFNSIMGRNPTAIPVLHIDSDRRRFEIRRMIDFLMKLYKLGENEGPEWVRDFLVSEKFAFKVAGSSKLRNMEAELVSIFDSQLPSHHWSCEEAACKRFKKSVE